MSTTNTFTKGMNMDIHPKYQTEGTYRYALNSVLETELGEIPSISNELGNKVCGSLPENKKVIGHTLTDNQDTILFLYDPNGDHEIGILNTIDCTYTSVAVDSCLNFSDKYPIDAIFRIRNGCERVVYFTDNLNEYRVVNLSNTSYWLDGTSIIDCNRIKVYKDYTVPCLNLLVGEGDIGVKDSTGLLQAGLYYFAIRYLDSELNPTNWIFITRPTAVSNELHKYTNDAGTTNLYDGASNNPTSPYYQAPSNKTIQIQLSQLDSSTFSYYQLAVVKRTGDGGEISSANILFPVPIDSATDVYTYTGQDSQIQTDTSLDELLSLFQPIDVVKSHAELDNRLYVAGVTNTNYDFSLFQRKASKIKTEWVKDASFSPVDTFVKQGVYYFNTASFMEDEIYALGIVYVMEDGSFSPVFHIPGRAPDVVTGDNPLIGTAGVADDAAAWDTGTVTSYGTGLPVSKTKRWHQISTATRYSNNANRGLMGYHEAVSETYPDITACDGESYWGEDWQGNEITSSTKIRHHRMPDATMVATSFADANTHQVGIRFSNVEYPEGAVRHFFVYGDRTQDRSILAKGALVPLITPEEFADNAEYDGDSPLGSGGFFSEYFGGDSDLVFAPQLLRPTAVPLTTSPIENLRTFAFFCSEGILKDKSFSPRYIRIEKFLKDSEYALGLGANRDSSNVDIPAYDDNMNIQTDLWYFADTDSFPTSQHNYDIDFIGKIPKATYGSKVGSILYNSSDRSIQNLSFNLSPIIITLEDQVDDWVTATTSPNDKIAFASLKVDIDPFTNLYNINYRRMGNCPLRATSLSSSFTLFGGDTFVSRVNITDYSYAQSEEDGKTLEAYHMAFSTQDTLINYEFRAGSIDPVYSYFQWNYQYDPEGHKQLRSHLTSKYYEVAEGVMEIYPQNPFYNDSFSYLESLDIYYPLPFNYRFCSDCIESYPYRIYYSEKDNFESTDDKYRIFRPNNYADIPASTGPITDIFVNFDELYARTTNSIYYLSTRPQQLQTDASTIYLGTGAVLSLPPKQLKTSENAFAGGRFFKGRVRTEYGTVYVDDISGRVFLLTNQLNDLSNIGLRNFFQQHGGISFLKQFYEQTGEEFPFFSTSSPTGVGYIAWYDPRFKRVFIHKKDYKILLGRNTFSYVPTDEDTPPPSLDENEIRFNGHSFYKDINGITQITFDDSDYFENKSFTLSYSFLTNNWISFHSFFPSYAFTGHTSHYTSFDDVYEHNSGDYTTYYGTKYPHIIDLIAVNSPLQAKISNSVYYTSSSYFHEPTTNSFSLLPETFDGVILYNSNQSTGYLNVQPKDTPFDIEYSNNSIRVTKVDKAYRFNEIRDVVLNNESPIWDSTWASLSPTPYLDKVPYEGNIDFNVSPFDLKRLRDHYLGVRLFLNNPLNIKIVTDIVSTQSANKNR